MPSSYSNVTDCELLFGYKDIVLYYEIQVKNNSRGFKIKRFMVYIRRAVPWHPCSKIADVAAHLSISDWQTNPIPFFTFANGKNQTADLLRHLRNSCAHGSFFKTNIRGIDFYCFEDYDPSGKLTMKGQFPVPALSLSIWSQAEYQQEDGRELQRPLQVKCWNTMSEEYRRKVLTCGFMDTRSRSTSENYLSFKEFIGKLKETRRECRQD